jgi:hypothetical protein
MEVLSFIFVALIFGAGILLTIGVRREMLERQERERNLSQGAELRRK